MPPISVSEGRTVFVGNIAFDVSEDELRSLLSTCDQVHSIRLVTDRGVEGASYKRTLPSLEDRARHSAQHPAARGARG